MNTAHKIPGSGFSLVEIVVAAAIIAAVGLALTGAWNQFIKMSQTSASLTQAALLTQEAGEALLIFRDKSWSGNIAPLALGTTYYIYWDTVAGKYSTSTTVMSANGKYVTSFIIGSVNRGANDDVVASGGSIDTNTVSTTISVAPIGSLASPISRSQMLIHNVYSN